MGISWQKFNNSFIYNNQESFLFHMACRNLENHFYVNYDRIANEIYCYNTYFPCTVR